MSADDAELVNYLVRMVIPMRREFGRKLDVGQFRLDPGYAGEVLELARTSTDPRLREYAHMVEKRLHGGARGNVPPSTPVVRPEPAATTAPIPTTSATAPAPPEADPASTTVDKAAEDALRAKVMQKYKSGLR